MTTLTLTTDDAAAFVESHVEAAAKALALHDGWTEMDWNMIPSRCSRKYYDMARAAFAAAHPELLATVKKQQARLDAVAQLAERFVSKPRTALDLIEQPAFGRGVRATGREIRSLLEDPL
ncbi:hypothetical protein WMO79_00935 [Micrococcaceae bacterium Sec7.4]